MDTILDLLASFLRFVLSVLDLFAGFLIGAIHLVVDFIHALFALVM